ncbi:MAG: DsbA family protein [Dichotomicrobium sp.]
MKQSRSKAQFVFRPAVTVAGLSVLGVIMLSALHEVSAPGVVAREAGNEQSAAQPAQPAESRNAAETDTTSDDNATDDNNATDSASGNSAAEQPAEPPVKMAEAQTEDAAAESGDQSQAFDDIVMGDPDAPVTVIEYASMTCPHCAAFHADTLPELKEQYIDTGQVKYILRAFPLDNLAAAAFMLARCVEEDNYYPFIDMLFEKQSQWADADEPLAELRQVTKVAGFTEDKFNRCIRDQQTLDYIQQVRDNGNQQYDIRSTPTLIVNGQKLEGNQSISQLKAVIDPLLSDAEKS